VVGAGGAAGLAACGAGAVVLRSLTAWAGLSSFGALEISHTDVRPSTNPNVRPANKRAAAANVRRRSISAFPCI
jgi:hypothetical protein